jgi:hypothetical protein
MVVNSLDFHLLGMCVAKDLDKSHLGPGLVMKFCRAWYDRLVLLEFRDQIDRSCLLKIFFTTILGIRWYSRQTEEGKGQITTRQISTKLLRAR